MEGGKEGRKVGRGGKGWEENGREDDGEGRQTNSGCVGQEGYS